MSVIISGLLLNSESQQINFIFQLIKLAKSSGFSHPHKKEPTAAKDERPEGMGREREEEF